VTGDFADISRDLSGLPELPATGARLRPPLTRQRVIMRIVIVGFLAATVWAWQSVDMSVIGLWRERDDVRSLIDRMTPPAFPGLRLTLGKVFETLWMAVIGTSLAVALSVPLAFGAARNTTPHRAVMVVCRAIIVLARAIPDLVFAMVFVRAVGIGVLPGVLALGLHSIGMVGKLFADAIEQTSPMPREAVVSVGSGKWQAIATSIVPQAMPSIISTTLYRLDINLRTSTVLGIVGAGGIGQRLKQFTGSLQWNSALGIVLIIFVFITTMEVVSALVRSSLLGGERTMVARSTPRFSLGASLATRLRKASVQPQRVGVRSFDRTKVTPPLTGERLAMLSYGGFFAALVLLAFTFVRLNPIEIVTAVPDIVLVGTRMFPLDFTTARDSLVEGVVESIAMALLATSVGFVLSLPLGLLAARNVTANRFVYALARVSIIGLRGTPELIVCVVFVAALGLGPVAGILALIIGSTGFFARLIADAAEEVDPLPREAVFTTGATRLQESTTSVIPQALPAIVGNLLYVLDVNLRSSAILGIVGAGGIGFLLNNSIKTLHWHTTGAIIFTVFAIVYAIELLAGWVRKQII
jgi:phosphonate transport system permease protein